LGHVTLVRQFLSCDARQPVTRVAGQKRSQRMHIEYDITEQDFLHGLQMVQRRTTPSLVRWVELASPFLGFALLIFIIYRITTQGMSGISALGLGTGLYFLFTPLISKNRQKRLYRNSDFLHGKLVLEVDEVGLRFGGETRGRKVQEMLPGRLPTFLRVLRNALAIPANRTPVLRARGRSSSLCDSDRGREYLRIDYCQSCRAYLKT
jgi:hypothetical protein